MLNSGLHGEDPELDGFGSGRLGSYLSVFVRQSDITYPFSGESYLLHVGVLDRGDHVHLSAEPCSFKKKSYRVINLYLLAFSPVTTTIDNNGCQTNFKGSYRNRELSAQGSAPWMYPPAFRCNARRSLQERNVIASLPCLSASRWRPRPQQ